jgi:hypothetical protein
MKVVLRYDEDHQVWWADVTTELGWMYCFAGRYRDMYFWKKYEKQLDHTFVYDMYHEYGMPEIVRNLLLLNGEPVPPGLSYE